MFNGLEAIFLENRTSLLRFLRARGADAHSEDLVQDVWLRASAQASGPIGNPRAYLFRIAQNLMVDRHRAEIQRRQRENSWSASTGGAEKGVSEEPLADHRMAAREQLYRVQSVLDDLGEPTPSIFRRFRIDNVPQKEIAAEFGVSLATVEKHLQKAYRAMAALKKELDTE
jgi:RNA polymerase sigma factor (sigma-70 family)